MLIQSKYPLYFSLTTRLWLSVFVAIYIVTECHQAPIWKSLSDPNVWITIICSIGIALILICIIHWITQLLDRTYDWRLNYRKRLLYQLILCILVPIALDIFLVKGFFWLFKLDYVQSRYETSELPLAKLLIYVLNGWYYQLYLQHQQAADQIEAERLKKIAAQEKELEAVEEAENLKREAAELEASSASLYHPNLVFQGTMGVHNRLFQVRDLSCFERRGRISLALLKDNSTWMIDANTETLEKMLNPARFFRINHKSIIGFDTIRNYKNNGKTGNVLFKEEIDFQGSTLISRDRYQNFKDSFKAYVENQ